MLDNNSETTAIIDITFVALIFLKHPMLIEDLDFKKHQTFRDKDF